MVINNYVWLLSTCNVAIASEELNLKFYLISINLKHHK